MREWERERVGELQSGSAKASDRARVLSHPPTLPLSHTVTLLLAAAALFFGRLNCPLLEPDEARYAEIPRQMLAEGKLLVPVLHGQPYLDKPPLLYWLVMGSYRLFGVHDWSARLVSCSTAAMYPD